jgi:hypothetical protein
VDGDLHIHTNVSDGALSPREVARRAVESPLGIFSVTDHNAVGALRAVEAALPGGRPRFVYGVELSSQPKEGFEVHILGYGVDPDAPALLEVCRQIVERKHEQLREIAHRLRRDGVDVDLAGELEGQEGGYAGRPLLAGLLVREGIVSSVGQAFGRYLRRDGPAYVSMRPYSPTRCIEAVRAAGGLAVLAHPTISTVDEWIQPLADAGLDGVEAYRPALSGNEQLYVEKAAEHFGLFVTGGSDWHGRDNEPPLGAFSVNGRQMVGFLRALDARGGRRG